MDGAQVTCLIASVVAAINAHALTAADERALTITVTDGVVSIEARNAACSVAGCSKFAKLHGHCIAHWHTQGCQSPRSQAAAEPPTMSPNGTTPTTRIVCKAKPAPPTRMCKTPGCQSYARRFGRCSRHGGASLCTVKGCSTPSQTGGRCRVHGGGSQCKVADCTTFARLHGFCLEHYEETLKQAVKAGDD
ncbi:hypothetical protein SPRG_10133 [Saprolegnia parasitica CBS 223.65]|uniref:Uncharacterized protein n=1 Tax=Saprolegnia parasitica (strain CBS 223.65) TaxID=695850 RepID=A0A067CCR6_SAPPC|nr:hypothetical protein SPRG_10133 [Saprolegnia parasitica CBS 223.65]KDO24602.1 hypothetical protein SPRG_10133 [Saprolegnia parasitica CBS 223.65]|eukprot:XP_012204670.1 hypothetical protein SPRG_10133 [Saprolegnia parasitica CBS 223.65]